MYTVLHAIVGYFLLLIALRVLRRRPGAQMTPFEFVLVFLMGGIIIGPMHRRMALLRERSRSLIDGKPLVLLKDGQWQIAAMHGASIVDDDVMAAARMKGVRTLDGIKYAVLERNGAISVIEKQ